MSISCQQLLLSDSVAWRNGKFFARADSVVIMFDSFGKVNKSHVVGFMLCQERSKAN